MKIVKKFILSVPAMVLLALLTATLILGQWVVFDIIQTNTKLADVKCEGAGFSIDKGQIELIVKCDGKMTSILDANTVLSYIKDPGPLNCTLNKAGKVDCQSRPEL